MMELYATLQMLKEQVNLVEEYTGDDTKLSRLLLTAQESVEKHIQQPLSGFVNEEGELNPMLVHAILIIAAHWYQNSEPVAFVQPRVIPYTYEYLLQPFKKYT